MRANRTLPWERECLEDTVDSLRHLASLDSLQRIFG